MYLDDKSTKGCVFQVGPKVFATRTNISGKIFNHFRFIEFIGLRIFFLLEPKLIEVFKPPGSSAPTFKIECSVPHEIDYCYIQTPDAPGITWDPITPDSFSSTKDLGLCRFTVKQLVSGLYTCGVNDIHGGEDIQTYYQVKVFTVPAQADEPYLIGDHGKTTKMLVKALFNQPMSFCRFVTPNGEVHGVSERFNMTGNLQYYGTGLGTGQCGLSVQKVDDNHFGVWKSIFKIDGHEYTIQIVVSESSKF